MKLALRGLTCIGLHLFAVGVGLAMYALMFPALWLGNRVFKMPRWGENRG